MAPPDVFNTDSSSPRQRKQDRNGRYSYKPTALGLPSLVVFLAIFALSIALIERLLRSTTHLSSDEESNTSSKIRRAACSNSTKYSSELANLEYTYDDLCSEFSSVLAPFSDQMPYELWTTFSVWSSSWSTLMQSKTAIISESVSCRATPLSTPFTSIYYITAGCASMMETIYNYQCLGYGQIFAGGSTIGTAWWPCTATDGTGGSSTNPGAVAPASHLVITSQTSAVASQSLMLTTSTVSAITSKSHMLIASQTSTVAPESTISQTSETHSRHDVVSAEPPKSHMTITSQTSQTTDVPQSTGTDSSQSTPPPGAIPDPSHMAVGSPTGSITPSATAFHLASDEVIATQPFTNLTYFYALFFAPVLTVFVKIYYEVIVSSLKLTEPFQHMSSSRGAPASYSLLSHYLSTATPKDVLKSTSAGHLLPLWSAIMHLLVGIAPALASASMSVRIRAYCVIDQSSRPCDPAWVINLTVIRLVEAALLLCACLVAFLIVSTWSFSVDVPSNPSSIVSIAAMLNFEPLQRDFLQIEPEANENSFNAHLVQHRFWLGEHQNPRSGQFYHGVIGQQDLTIRPPPQAEQQSITASPSPRTFSATIIQDLFHLITALCLLGLVLTYTLDYSHDIFNEFFSSEKVLPKLIIVGIATLANTQLKALERTVRTTDLYRRLALGQARPETTILLPLHGTCWSNLPRCIFYLVRHRNSHMKWQTIVSLVACLGDFNIIAVAGLLFTSSQTWTAFQACSWVSVVLSAVMLLVALVNVVWWGRVKVFREMPRRPQTVAAVMSYLCGSSCLNEWTGQQSQEKTTLRFGDMTERERWGMIVQSGRLFRFGKMRSVVDERVRWCIEFDSGLEQEPLLALSK